MLSASQIRSRWKMLGGVLLGLLMLIGCGKKSSPGGGGTGGSASAQFQEYTSSDGRYKVSFPGTPQAKTSQSPGGVTMSAMGVDEKDGAYLVQYGDLSIPPGETDQQLQQRLDALRDATGQALGGKVTRFTPIKLAGKYPGRELEATVPSKNGTLRARMYLVNQRLYEVMAVGTSSWVSSPNTNTFFNSFSLTQ
jgi:hypothetical protein